MINQHWKVIGLIRALFQAQDFISLHELTIFSDYLASNIQNEKWYKNCTVNITKKVETKC